MQANRLALAVAVFRVHSADAVVQLAAWVLVQHFLHERDAFFSVELRGLGATRTETTSAGVHRHLDSSQVALHEDFRILAMSHFRTLGKSKHGWVKRPLHRRLRSMNTDMTTVWHVCSTEKHHQCVADDLAEVGDTLPAPHVGTIVWELHPPISKIVQDKISWTEAMRWPHQVSTK